MNSEPKVGDTVNFTSYTGRSYTPVAGTGVVTEVNPYYEWRPGQRTTVISIKDKNGYVSKINHERVKKV